FRLYRSLGRLSGTRMTRRELLRQMGFVIGVAAGLPSLVRAQARRQGLAAVGDVLVSLTPAEAETLRAIIARIVPADENGPGALEARADRFIDRALAGALKNQRPAYSDGLASVDSFAQSSKGALFAKLSATDQDAVLTEMQANRATGFTGDSGQFFNLVRTH